MEGRQRHSSGHRYPVFCGGGLDGRRAHRFNGRQIAFVAVGSPYGWQVGVVDNLNGSVYNAQTMQSTNVADVVCFILLPVVTSASDHSDL